MDGDQKNDVKVRDGNAAAFVLNLAGKAVQFGSGKKGFRGLTAAIDGKLSAELTNTALVAEGVGL